MGGFSAIISRRAIGQAERDAVRAMYSVQSYRTKGAICTQSYDNAAFASGHEWHIDGYYAALDGRIYNFNELTKELADHGCVLEIKTEAELLAALYSQYGSGFINKLRGLFSFLIYDVAANTVMAARDSFATKPLYYRQTADSVVFSSEYKGFLYDSTYDGYKIDKTALQHYFTFQFVPEQNTISGDIFCVEKGSYMVFGEETEKVVYNKTLFTPKKSIPYDQKKAALRNAIEKSVELHVAGDAKLGALLSSGVDSAVVTALACKIKPKMKAFTVSFDVKGYSELDDAAVIANKLDIEHMPLRFGLKDFVENFEQTLFHLDAPVGDPSVVAIYLLNREASKHVDAVLAGEGSDELFGGYRVYATAPISDKIYKLPSFAKDFLRVTSKVFPKGRNMIYRGCVPVEKRFIGNSFVFSEREKSQFLKTFDPMIHYTDCTKPIYDQVENYSTLLKMQYCDLHTWMPGDICVKGDRLASAHGLELRTPYVDREVFKAASALCDGDKIKKGTTKYIFRDAFRDLLGEDIIWRPKLGFPVPTREWLKDELYDWAQDILKNSTMEEYIDIQATLKLLEKHRSGEADLYHPLWTIISMLTWHKRFIADSCRYTLAE